MSTYNAPTAVGGTFDVAPAAGSVGNTGGGFGAAWDAFDAAGGLPLMQSNPQLYSELLSAGLNPSNMTMAQAADLFDSQMGQQMLANNPSLSQFLGNTGLNINLSNTPTRNPFDPTGQNSNGPSGQGNGGIPTSPNSVGTGPINPASVGANASGSVLERILNGTASTQDYLSLAGSLGSSALGLFGSNAQTGAFENTADKYLGLGAPYRNLLQQSYQPGFSMMNEPGYKDALDSSTNSFLRAASSGRAPGVSGGNPMDNPGAWAETQKYVTSNTALPALNTYRSQLGTFGQLGTNIGGTADLNAAAGAGNAYNAAGYGLGQITNPSNSLSDLLARFQQLGGGNNTNGFKAGGVNTF
jgi:hypothetical protein